MNTWTMPRIVVDKFRPNDHVAGCGKNGRYEAVLSSRALYWDVYASITADWGNGDTFYQDNENVTANGTSSCTVDAAVPGGWYKGIDFYSSHTSGLGGFLRFYSSFVDSLDVYVFNDAQSGKKTAYLYVEGTAANFQTTYGVSVPRLGHNYS